MIPEKDLAVCLFNSFDAWVAPVVARNRDLPESKRRAMIEHAIGLQYPGVQRVPPSDAAEMSELLIAGAQAVDDRERLLEVARAFQRAITQYESLLFVAFPSGRPDG